jgi:ORF6N domain
LLHLVVVAAVVGRGFFSALAIRDSRFTILLDVFLVAVGKVSVKDCPVAIILKPENLARFVFFIRSEKVMLDSDLARLYGVEARALNQAVARNRKRFPADFMFQLTDKEYERIRSQFVTTSGRAALHSSQTVMSSRKHRGRHYRPYAFTEQGVAMLSSVLRSSRAVEVNIAIMRTFVQLRRLMDTNRDLARKIEALEKKYDEQFAVVFDAIKELIALPEPPKKQIGFHP